MISLDPNGNLRWEKTLTQTNAKGSLNVLYNNSVYSLSLIDIGNLNKIRFIKYNKENG